MQKTKTTSSSILNEDLQAEIGVLFDVEYDLQEQYESLSKEEKKLLYDIRVCLENLGEWIALPNPDMPPYTSLAEMSMAIRDKDTDIYQRYVSEIECWAESNQEKINTVIQRVTAWLFPD
jgi:hypothetical protein